MLEQKYHQKDFPMELPIDYKNWQLGLELDTFVEGMQTHRMQMQRRLKTVALNEAEVNLLKNINCF